MARNRASRALLSAWAGDGVDRVDGGAGVEEAPALARELRLRQGAIALRFRQRFPTRLAGGRRRPPEAVFP